MSDNNSEKQLMTNFGKKFIISDNSIKKSSSNISANIALKKPFKLSNIRIPSKYRLFLMLLPFLVLVLVFSYFPLYGWRYAFYDYKPAIPLSKSKFVGWYWFELLFSSSYTRKELIRVLKNTFAMSFLGIGTSWMPIVFALLLNEINLKKYKTFVQTVTTIPNFISWVLVYSFAFMLLSVDNGLINILLKKWGWIEKDINFLISNKFIWLKMWSWSTWKGLGWGAIMYLAAISGIDKELYEAAEVDGAGRFAKMWHISLPGILPTYFVLLLLSIANIINNGMEQYWAFQNDFNKSTIEVLDLYVFNLGFSSSSNIPLATVISMFKSLISVTMLFLANSFSKLIRKESII